jgi:hypothetical protein
MTMPVRRLGGAVSISILTLALAACGGSTPTAAVTASPAAPATQPPPSVAPSASAPAASSGGQPGASLATTGRIVVADKGYALTLPDGWHRIDVSQSDMEAMMQAAGVVDPAVMAQYETQIKAMMAAGLSIFAFGPDPSSGTNLNVMALPGAGMSLDLLEQLNTSQIQALAGGDVTSERVTLPAGEAVHFRYEIKAQGVPSGTSIDQYLLLVGDNQLVVTATNATAEDAASIANSIEALD